MAMSNFQRKSLKILGIAIPLILIALFLIFPIISVLIKGIIDEEGLTFEYFRAILSDRYYYQIFGFTLGQAILSTMLSLIIGVPIGYFFGKYNFPAKKILLIFFTVPFVLPSVLVGMGFLSIFGEGGLFYTTFSIILAHVFYNVPLFIHYISAYYQNFDKDLINVAKTAGSKNLHLIFRVYLPLFLPPILIASLLTFLFCFLSYGIVTILGATVGLRTIETQIYSEYFELEPNIASALSILQLLITMAIVLGYVFLIRSKTKNNRVISTNIYPYDKLILKKFLKKISNYFILFVLLIGLLLEIAPLISIIIKSFWDPFYSKFTNNFSILFSEEIESSARISVGKAILNTLGFCFGSAIIASILAIITVITIREKRLGKWIASIEMLTFLPLTISSITLALGLSQIFIKSNFIINHPAFFILISHGLLGYPFVTRAILNGLYTIDTDILDCAKTLGAKWFYQFKKIYVPLLLPAFIAGFIFALGLSIGEFSTSNFFANNNDTIATLTVVLFRLKDARKFGPANAVGVILLLVSYMSFFILEMFRAREKTAPVI